MPSDNLETQFAPAERELQQIVERQSESFKNSAFYSEVLDTIPDQVMVLNGRRQIIFANESLIHFLSRKDLEKLLGQRQGEALQCVHSDERPGGCGTTAFCSTCGALKAILISLNGKPDVEEIRLMRKGGQEPLDMRITSAPLYLDREVFSVSTLTDVSHEKRRRALEQIFFHDILNTAGALAGYAKVVARGGPQDVKEYGPIVHNLARRLVDEIETQKELLAAERGELMPDAKRTRSLEVLNEVVELYRNHEVAQGRTISIAPGSRDALFNVDQALLRRVVGNMLKNRFQVFSDRVFQHHRRGG